MMGQPTERMAPMLRALYRGPAGLSDLREVAGDPTMLEALRELTQDGIVSQIGKAGTEVFKLTRKGEHLVEAWAAGRLMDARA